MDDNKDRGITITTSGDSSINELLVEALNDIGVDAKIEAPKKEIISPATSLLGYCAVSGYMPYMGSPRRRDSLPEKEQLRKIALAQQKRERKINKKGLK